MNWWLAAAAPGIIGLVLLGTGWVHLAVLAYHALCAASIIRRWSRIRPLLRRDPATWRWILGTTILIAFFLCLGPLVHDPSSYRDLFRATLFPGGRIEVLFPVFAVYTLAFHAPLEEVFWRAVVTDPARADLQSAVAGNAVFFGLLHAVPLTILLGPMGLLVSLPTAAAGAVWALVTIRTRSLWPALVSHWGADALILGGMWFFFIR